MIELEAAMSGSDVVTTLVDEGDALFDIAPPPELPPGIAKVFAGELLRMLAKLKLFVGTKKADLASCGHVWLYTENRQLVGVATDLAAIAQADTKLATPSRLPLLGLSRDNIKDLREALPDLKDLVTLRVDGAELRIETAGELVLTLAPRTPDPTDLGVLDDQVERLHRATRHARTSECPHGYAELGPAIAHFLRTGPDIRLWHLPGGSVYVESDGGTSGSNLRGVALPARAGARLRRPDIRLRPIGLPAHPETERKAA